MKSLNITFCYKHTKDLLNIFTNIPMVFHQKQSQESHKKVKVFQFFLVVYIKIGLL